MSGRRHLTARAMIAQYRQHLAECAAAIARDQFAATRQASTGMKRVALVLARIATRIRSGEIKRGFAIPPSASARIAFDVSRSEVAGVNRESVRDARALLDASRDPLMARTLEHISFGVIGDDESAAVAEIDVVLRGTALSPALDQCAGNFSRFARSLRALESKPHEIHPKQTGRRKRLARQHRFIADRDAMLVEPMLETPQPERPRTDHSGSL